MHRIVFTGGPGSGKSTLLAYLEQQGFTVIKESARQIMQSRRAAGLAPRPSPAEFAMQILQRDLDNHAMATSAVTLFDRSLVDALCMLDAASALAPERLAEYLKHYLYHSTVFVLPPWREIYCQDDERDQSYGDAVQVFEAMSAWYRRCGYQLVEVPCMPVAQRAEFVLQLLRDQGVIRGDLDEDDCSRLFKPGH